VAMGMVCVHSSSRNVQPLAWRLAVART
jgi:hypothetical protein